MKRKNKKALPPVLFSGVFTVRENVELKTHSGILCVDLDKLGERLTALKAMLKKDPYVLAEFASPTGDGLKMLVRTPAASACPKQVFLTVAAHFKEKYGVDIDHELNCSKEEKR